MVRCIHKKCDKAILPLVYLERDKAELKREDDKVYECIQMYVYVYTSHQFPVQPANLFAIIVLFCFVFACTHFS